MFTNTLDCRGTLFNQMLNNEPIGDGEWGGPPGAPDAPNYGDWGQVFGDVGPCGTPCGCRVHSLGLKEFLTFKITEGQIVPSANDRRTCSNDVDSDGFPIGFPLYYTDANCNQVEYTTCVNYIHTPSLYLPHFSLLTTGARLRRVTWPQVSRFFEQPIEFPSIFAAVAPANESDYAGSNGDCCNLVYGFDSFGTYVGRSVPTTPTDIIAQLPFHISTGPGIPAQSRTIPKLCCPDPNAGVTLYDCVTPDGFQDGREFSLSPISMTASCALKLTLCKSGFYQFNFSYVAQNVFHKKEVDYPANPRVVGYSSRVFIDHYFADYSVSIRCAGTGTIAGQWSKEAIQNIVMQAPAILTSEAGQPLSHTVGPVAYELVFQPSEWLTATGLCGPPFAPCRLVGRDSITDNLVYHQAGLSPLKAKLLLP